VDGRRINSAFRITPGVLINGIVGDGWTGPSNTELEGMSDAEFLHQVEIVAAN
jgi:hypothetical protein